MVVLWGDEVHLPPEAGVTEIEGNWAAELMDGEILTIHRSDCATSVRWPEVLVADTACTCTPIRILPS